jgi:hypothetical protein
MSLMLKYYKSICYQYLNFLLNNYLFFFLINKYPLSINFLKNLYVLLINLIDLLIHYFLNNQVQIIINELFMLYYSLN